MLGGTDEGPPESIHRLHGLGQPARGEEDQPLCRIPGHGWDLLHAGDAGGAGGLQVVSHAAHQPGAVAHLPRDTSSAAGPGSTSPSGQDRDGPGLPVPSAPQSLSAFGSLLCKSQGSFFSMIAPCPPPARLPPRPGPRGPPVPGCASAAGRGEGQRPRPAASCPRVPAEPLLGTVPSPAGSHHPSLLGPWPGDLSGAFRGSVGCSVLTPHSSKGVTLPGVEAARSPQLWGVREGGCWGSPPASSPSSPPRCSSGFSRDGGLVPKRMGGTFVIHGQEDALGFPWLTAPLAHCAPFLHTSLVWLSSFFPAFSCFSSGTLLCLRLSQPAAVLCPSPWTCGTSGVLGLASLPWKGSRKPLLGGGRTVPSTPPCLS